MSLPKTKDVGKIMDKLKSEGGKSREQMVAIALDQARKNGANIPAPKKKDKKHTAMAMRAARANMS